MRDVTIQSWAQATTRKWKRKSQVELTEAPAKERKRTDTQTGWRVGGASLRSPLFPFLPGWFPESVCTLRLSIVHSGPFIFYSWESFFKPTTEPKKSFCLTHTWVIPVRSVQNVESWRLTVGRTYLWKIDSTSRVDAFNFATGNSTISSIQILILLMKWSATWTGVIFEFSRQVASKSRTRK